VVLGSADDLPAEMVIYTIGPTWHGGDYEEEQQLASCYYNAMEAAKKHDLKSIAFPTISCGALGFPARRAVKIAIYEVNQALRQNPLLELVVFCCLDPVTTALYRNQMGK
jgi:O-acetyl-ADP-ribose deacetylase (regulator of RNase III)